MSQSNKDLEALLNQILDVNQPLPTTPSVGKAVVATIMNQNQGRVTEAAFTDPDSFLDAFLGGDATALNEASACASTMGINVLQSAAALAQKTPKQVVQQLATMTREQAVTQLCDEPQTFTGIKEQLPALKMPTFVGDDFADTIDIRNFCTLVTLNTSKWHAKVKDKQASMDAAIANDANSEAFETKKRLLVGADEKLKAIHRAMDEARVAHYEMTLPWTTTGIADVGRRTGGRLLPNTLFVEYTKVMAEKRAAMQQALDAFVPEYPDLIESARQKLGKRFDPSEYPNSESIRAHFDLSFDFQPIPQGQDFKGLPQQQLNALARKVNDNTRKMAENAMQDIWVRVHEAVARMAERLSSPDKSFHATLVTNIQDLVRLMGHLNFTGDQRVKDLATKMNKYLCQNDADFLRKNPTIRLATGAHAKSILEEMAR